MPAVLCNPLNIENGVATVAELEVVKFMETAMNNGNGIMIDARTPSWHEKGTIPGSVNIPFTSFEKDPGSVELAELFESLGAVFISGFLFLLVDFNLIPSFCKNLV